MYNNTNTDVKVPVEVSPQLGNHGKKTKETCTFMLFSLDSFFYICGVGSYWMINLFTKTDPAKNVWTRAYLIPERNRTVRKQEEGNNSVYLFVFCMNLGEINALLTISCCQMKHFGYVIVY
jgi:hypothetical protein